MHHKLPLVSITPVTRTTTPEDKYLYIVYIVTDNVKIVMYSVYTVTYKVYNVQHVHHYIQRGSSPRGGFPRGSLARGSCTTCMFVVTFYSIDDHLEIRDLLAIN